MAEAASPQAVAPDASSLAKGVSMLAVLGLTLETALSGLISVYMQSIFQMHVGVMWRRNVQLSALSVLFYLATSLYTNAIDGNSCTAATYYPDVNGEHPDHIGSPTQEGLTQGVLFSPASPSSSIRPCPRRQEARTRLPHTPPRPCPHPPQPHYSPPCRPHTRHHRRNGWAARGAEHSLLGRRRKGCRHLGFDCSDGLPGVRVCEASVADSRRDQPLRGGAQCCHHVRCSPRLLGCLARTMDILSGHTRPRDATPDASQPTSTVSRWVHVLRCSCSVLRCVQQTSCIIKSSV